jgi:hypothetical protein
MSSTGWIVTAISSGVAAHVCLFVILFRLHAAGFVAPSIWLWNIPFLWSPEIYSFAPYLTYWRIAPQKHWSRAWLLAAIVFFLFTPYAFLHFVILRSPG